MSSIFNPREQSEDIDLKIIAGLERISRIFRLLLWDVAKNENLSPIQIQFLIYLLYNQASRSRITDIANEFILTKATVSDAISSLEEKKLITKIESKDDKRSHIIKLTPKGKKLATRISTWADVFKSVLEKSEQEEKEAVLKFIFRTIELFYDAGFITVQRMCFTCIYFQKNIHPNLSSPHHCKLLNKPLSTLDLRLDCEDYISITSPTLE